MRSVLLLSAALVATALANPVDPRQANTYAVTFCPIDHECVVVDGKSTCLPRGSTLCGPSWCAKGLHCYNPSCGICTKPDQHWYVNNCFTPLSYWFRFSLFSFLFCLPAHLL